MDFNTVAIELPVDTQVLRARLLERIDAIEHQLKVPAISTLNLELEQHRLRTILALHAD